KKESTGLRLNRLCPPYVTPSSISSFGRRPSSAHIAERKSLKNSGENTFCQSSARQGGSACFVSIAADNPAGIRAAGDRRPVARINGRASLRDECG
ncbi:hypothetical protein ABIB75_004807, partial [Bradyrhizobium sp. GM2.2]|uniref:hypothetical protein n=2 Tax=Bradyrhizobium TaxID=374 RepID=UPI00339ADC79